MITHVGLQTNPSLAGQERLKRDKPLHMGRGSFTKQALTFQAHLGAARPRSPPTPPESYKLTERP